MIISKIEPLKKHLNRIVFEDGSELFIDKDVCCENGIAIGMELYEEDAEKLHFVSEYSRAKSRALWYLDRMDYTEKKLYEKLITAGFDKKACAKLMARLVETGLVDDRRYAERFADRLMEANVSKREAVHKMLYRGIPYDLAKEVLENCDTDEDSRLAALIESRYADKLCGENGYQKVYAALVRKGFSYSAVKTALKKYTQELEFSEEY